MSMLKTFRVRFAVVDYYTIEIKAKNRAAAISEAKGLYLGHFQDAYTFDIAHGGTRDWQAEEEQS